MVFESWGLAIGLGYFALPISGVGLTGHYQLAPDLGIEAGFYRGSYNGREFLKNDPNSTIVLDSFDVAGALNYIGVRYALGPHFYAAAGLGTRSITFDLKARSGNDIVYETLEADAGIARFAMGHCWNFPSGFFLDAEWASLAIPVTSMVSTEITASGTVRDDLETLESDAIRIAEGEAKRPTYGITMKFGWEF